MIHIYYGMGKGKTSSAVGAGMRACGAGKKVLLIQFLKDCNSSELKVLPFDIFKAPDNLSFNPDESYREWVDSALSYVKRSDADFIILDEFIDIIGDFITVSDAVKLIKSLSAEAVLTGHKNFDELTEIADYVTYFEKIKHPYDKGVKARMGIEY